jgi:hypothetical protein
VDDWRHNGLAEVGWPERQPGYWPDPWTRDPKARPKHTVCPLVLAHTALERRDGQVLRSVLAPDDG